MDVQEDDNISVDPFQYDNSGVVRSGGVRCSSDGEGTTRYHDPATHFFEGSEVSIASVIPNNVNLRGVVVPRSKRLGGSKGFDPHKPRLINIDPFVRGRSSVVDLSKINKESVEEAYKKAIEMCGSDDDPSLIASQTFRNLAISTEPEKTFDTNAHDSTKAPPLPGAFTVPRARKGVVDNTSRTQVNSSQRVSSARHELPPASIHPPQKIVETNPQPESHDRQAHYRHVHRAPIGGLLAQVQCKVAAGQNNNGDSKPAPLPMKKVLFEARGWGQLPYMYHDVVKNDNIMVLVFDTRAVNCTKLFPPVVPPDEQDPRANLLAVQLEDDPNIYLVHSTGTTFVHNNYEYCILVIAETFTDTPSDTSVAQESNYGEARNHTERHNTARRESGQPGGASDKTRS